MTKTYKGGVAVGSSAQTERKKQAERDRDRDIERKRHRETIDRRHRRIAEVGQLPQD